MLNFDFARSNQTFRVSERERESERDRNKKKDKGREVFLGLVPPKSSQVTW